jgi:hypothetical protein
MMKHRRPVLRAPDIFMYPMFNKVPNALSLYLFPVHFALTAKVFRLRPQGRDIIFLGGARANALACPK